MSPLKSSFVCLSLSLWLMVYAVLSLFALLFIFKQKTVWENETYISNTTSTDRSVLCERSNEEKGPGGGGEKQGNDEDYEVLTDIALGALHRDKDVSSWVALLFIQANISVTKYWIFSQVIENNKSSPAILRLCGGGRKKPKVQIFDEHMNKTTPRNVSTSTLLGCHFCSQHLSSSRNISSGWPFLGDKPKRRLQRRLQVGMNIYSISHKYEMIHFRVVAIVLSSFIFVLVIVFFNHHWAIIG